LNPRSVPQPSQKGTIRRADGWRSTRSLNGKVVSSVGEKRKLSDVSTFRPKANPIGVASANGLLIATLVSRAVGAQTSVESFDGLQRVPKANQLIVVTDSSSRRDAA
jgi:hypothetical protein